MRVDERLGVEAEDRRHLVAEVGRHARLAARPVVALAVRVLAVDEGDAEQPVHVAGAAADR